MEATPERPRILLVEDEDALRSTLRLNFELEGYDVTTVTNGPDALVRLRGARFDAVAHGARASITAAVFRAREKRW